MKIVRYFHMRPLIRKGREWEPRRNGGGTVMVTGDTDIIGQVDIQFTLCSNKDIFCKKVGREEASKAPIKIVALRNLPRELLTISEIIDEKSKRPTVDSDYNYAIRYFLPKE